MTLIKSISGIRGIVGGKPGEGLTPVDTVKFAAAFGSWIKNNQGTGKVVIGRDARVTGEMLSKLVTGTLQGLGLNVVDLGMATTPTVEIAIGEEQADGGIILTASHNPGQWNALKLLNHEGEFISDAVGKEVLAIADKEDFSFENARNTGKYVLKEGYLQKHIDQILALPEVDVEAITSRNFRIAVDCINSVGGLAVPALLRDLGVQDITVFYGEPNGLFQHNPEPLPENLSHLCSQMEQGRFDLGIAVDPDVDRLALINEDGTPFGEEYTLVAVSDYILGLKGGNTVSNLSSTMALKDITEKHGYQYFPSAVGEVNVVAAMKEHNAVIGGEGNGGIIYPGLHYGRDALVGIAFFLSQLAKFGGPVSRLRATYPAYHMSKNKIELTPDIDMDAILKGVQEIYHKKPIDTRDGLKIHFDKEWVHLRKSNTEPIIRIYCESDAPATADHLARKIMGDIREIIASGMPTVKT